MTWAGGVIGEEDEGTGGVEESVRILAGTGEQGLPGGQGIPQNPATNSSKLVSVMPIFSLRRIFLREMLPLAMW